MKTSMTCIYCPIGCTLEVVVEKGKVSVRGNRCPRGCEYARQEIFDPKRVLFTVIRVDTPEYRVAAVRSRVPVPKNKIGEILDKLSKIRIPNGLNPGDTIAVVDGYEFILTRE